MVFSGFSRNVRIEQDPQTNQTLLHAEGKDSFGDWQPTSICLDEHLGISQEHKGFDITQEQTLSAQGKSLSSVLVPGSLTLKENSVLYAKFREEYGGWETSIFLDLLFSIDDQGLFVREGWSNSLLQSVGAIAMTKDGEVTALLLAPDGKLATSHLSLTKDCQFNRGTIEPRSDNREWQVREGRCFAALDLVGLMQYSGEEKWIGFNIAFNVQLTSSKGKLSLEKPAKQGDISIPTQSQKELRKGLASLGFNVAGKDALSAAATKATAQCSYTSAILAGFIVGQILYGKVGASYAPALAFKTASIIQSATGPFVSDPKLSDEVAAVAIYRVLKAELPAATGLSLPVIMNVFDTNNQTGGNNQVSIKELKSDAETEYVHGGLDASVFWDMTEGWEKIQEVVLAALLEGKSEDYIKHSFDDHAHDGMDLLLPPPPGLDDYINRWRRNIVAVQDQLFLLEPKVGNNAEQSTAQALAAISNGLTGLNQLLEIWPDYTGDEATNKQRMAIIQSTTDLVTTGVKTIKKSEDDDSVLNQVLAIEQTLNAMKTEFTEDTASEQAALDSLKPELQKAVEKMFADQKIYQSAQNELMVKVKEVADQEHKHVEEATIEGGIRWYKDFLRRRISALETTQLAADIAAETYFVSEKTVTNLQTRQILLNDTHKGRVLVQREISKAEMIIRVLKLMIDGTKREENRILAVVDLMSTTLTDLTHIGEPPYHRPNRNIEDKLCTAVLAVHRESLVDASFVESTRKAVTLIQDWFGDDMPKATQQEIDEIVKNPLYKA